ncbi:MAG: hypothetical protein P1U56_05660 [Saprospiraceae bacterium]|nr:hypothetical protein [Saprospiraceae bacterium]
MPDIFGCIKSLNNSDMKKYIIFICTIFAFYLLAFTYTKNTASKKSATITHCNAHPANPIDLVYKVDSRFTNRITKEKLHQAKTIIDILPEKATHSRSNYHNVEISVLNGNCNSSISGKDENLNEKQIDLLSKLDYSSNILVKSNFLKNTITPFDMSDNYLTYYMTIMPEHQASYGGGRESLITYLREHTKDATSIISKSRLQPGKVSFVVTKNGSVENVQLNSTSGYPSVDEVLLATVTQIPGEWKPATNSNGEAVDQELIFFFGLEGC